MVKTEILVGVGIVAGLTALGYWAIKAAGGVLPDVIDAINPLSPNNLAYKGVNTLLSPIISSPSNPDATLGTWIAGVYTMQNPDGTYTTVDNFDPTKYTQSDLEKIIAAGNHYGTQTGGWIVG